MAKIMLVEDDTNLSEIYAARMSAEGYNIVSARDGEEALAIAAKEKPDLIISDVMMPKISGFEMLDILRNTDGLKNTKVIMLTALGQAEDKQRSDSLGADRYLVKSQVTLEDIVKAAQELLNDNTPLPASLATAPATADPSPIPQAAPQPVASTPTPAPAPAPAPLPSASPTAPASPPVQTLGVSGRPGMQAPAAPAHAQPVQSQPAAPAPAATAAAANPQSEDALATQAVQNFVSDAAASGAQAPANPASPQPASVTSSQAPVDDGAVTHKKIISPIGETVEAPKPDINALLAAEESKNPGVAPQPVTTGDLQGQTTATPVEPPHTPGNVVAPGPADPNSVAL